jgi:uncharacterized membrane protein
MSSGHPDPLVDAYLSRLETAAAALPFDRRADFVAEIRAHIEDALGEAGTSDEVTVRNVLERLGPPVEIAAAIGSIQVEVPQTAQGQLETVAVVVLAFGGLLPVVGWLVGLLLVLASDFWSSRDKTIGLLLGLLPGVAFLFVRFFVSDDAVTRQPSADSTTGGGGLGPFE